MPDADWTSGGYPALRNLKRSSIPCFLFFIRPSNSFERHEKGKKHALVKAMGGGQLSNPNEHQFVRLQLRRFRISVSFAFDGGLVKLIK
jgi:hypothetical protein